VGVVERSSIIILSRPYGASRGCGDHPRSPASTTNHAHRR